jgi:hypothetical protein
LTWSEGSTSFLNLPISRFGSSASKSPSASIWPSSALYNPYYKRLGKNNKLMLHCPVTHLKEEALDRIKWRNRFGRGCGPVVCLTDYWWMNVQSTITLTYLW